MTYEISAIGTVECSHSNKHSHGQNMTNICTVGLSNQTEMKIHIIIQNQNHEGKVKRVCINLGFHNHFDSGNSLVCHTAITDPLSRVLCCQQVIRHFAHSSALPVCVWEGWGRAQ